MPAGHGELSGALSSASAGLRQCLALHPATHGHCISRRKMPPCLTELDLADRRLTDAEASGDLSLLAGRHPDRLDRLGREFRPPGPGSRTAGGPFEGLVGASCYFERSKVMLLRVMSFRKSNN